MKVVVDSVSGKVRGAFLPPLNFSVSGKYVVDVPVPVGVPALVADLETAKVAAFAAAHPLFTQTFSEEFVGSGAVDLALSTGVSVGPKKSTVIYPGGVLYTSLFSVSPASFVLAHWNVFRLHRSTAPLPGTDPTRPAPARLLYNYDPALPGFSEPSHSLVRVDFTNSVGGIIQGPLPFDTESGTEIGSVVPCRLKFTSSASFPLRISDWIFLAR